MREEFLGFADKLIGQDDLVSVYESLIKIFDENCLFHEEGACNEKLWHITQKPELYKKVGDVFANKVGNFEVAFHAYNRYIQFSDENFYRNYMRAVKKLGYEYDKPDEDDYTLEIIKLCDAFDAIVYMMICLFRQKEYNAIFEMDKKLYEMQCKINEYIARYPDIDSESYVNDNVYSIKHLSQILSENKHHNDINLLAIKYDNTNKQAYINIIGDYITYKNYNEAIHFYNCTYSNIFSLSNTNNIVDICWHVSDYYRDNFDFYNSVYFQKHALEIYMKEV